MDRGTGDKLKGDVREGEGRAQEAWGDVTNDPEAQAEGQAKQGEGKIDQAKGGIKGAAGKVGDAIHDLTD